MANRPEPIDTRTTTANSPSNICLRPLIESLLAGVDTLQVGRLAGNGPVVLGPLAGVNDGSRLVRPLEGKATAGKGDRRVDVQGASHIQLLLAIEQRTLGEAEAA